MRTVVLRLAIVVLLATVRPARADIVLTEGGLWRIRANVRAMACAAGQCASDSAQQERTLSLPLATLRRFSKKIGKDVLKALTLEGSVAARNHLGGTAPAQVRAAARPRKR